jgi:hypothetical protein
MWHVNIQQFVSMINSEAFINETLCSYSLPLKTSQIHTDILDWFCHDINIRTLKWFSQKHRNFCQKYNLFSSLKMIYACSCASWFREQIIQIMSSFISITIPHHLQGKIHNLINAAWSKNYITMKRLYLIPK